MTKDHSTNSNSHSIMHSFPFIDDGPKINNNKQKATQTSSTDTIQVPPGVIHIKPTWKPVKLDEKPPFSYATIIAHAILSSEYRKLTLHEIYQWISQEYPCYSMNDHRWQNSIRHNLSLQKAFAKLERSTSAPGKGCYWTLLPGYEQHFIDNLIKRGSGCAISSDSSNMTTARRSGKQQDATTHKQFKKFIHDSTTDNNSHLFTIFRMNPTKACEEEEEQQGRPNKRKKTNKASKSVTATPVKALCTSPASPETANTAKEIGGYDSDCDSGVDLNCSFTTTTNKETISPYSFEYSSSSSSLWMPPAATAATASTTADLSLLSPTTPATNDNSAVTIEEEAYFKNLTTLSYLPLQTSVYWPSQQQTSSFQEFSNYFDATTLIDSTSYDTAASLFDISASSSFASSISSEEEHSFFQPPSFSLYNEYY